MRGDPPALAPFAPVRAISPATNIRIQQRLETRFLAQLQDIIFHGESNILGDRCKFDALLALSFALLLPMSIEASANILEYGA